MRAKPKTREDWLSQAVDALRPLAKAAGYTVPDKVRVSCGWPRGSRGGRKTIGQCWPTAASLDATFEMFISPVLSKPMDVLHVLVHEVGHAAVGLEHKHDRKFADYCRAMYLKGPWTATTPDEGFDVEIAARVFKLIGDEYPHAAMVDASRMSKQGTRLLKVQCTDPDCGCVFRLTQKWVQYADEGLVCPVCHGPAGLA